METERVMWMSSSVDLQIHILYFKMLMVMLHGNHQLPHQLLFILETAR